MDKWTLEEEEMLIRIDEAISAAGQLLDMIDVSGDDPDEYQDIWEERFHCGVCTVRTVMETVWPSIERYIEFCKSNSFPS